MLVVYYKADTFDFEVQSIRTQLNKSIKICNDLKLRAFFLFEGFEDKINSLNTGEKSDDVQYLDLTRFNDILFELQLELNIDYEFTETE